MQTLKVRDRLFRTSGASSALIAQCIFVVLTTWQLTQLSGAPWFWLLAGALALARLVLLGVQRVSHPEPYVWTADQTDRLHAAVGTVIRVRGMSRGFGLDQRVPFDATDELIAVVIEHGWYRLEFEHVGLREMWPEALEVIPVPTSFEEAWS